MAYGGYPDGYPGTHGGHPGEYAGHPAHNDERSVYALRTTPADIERRVLLDLARVNLPPDTHNITEIKNWLDGELLEQLLVLLFKKIESKTKKRISVIFRHKETPTKRCFNFLVKELDMTIVGKNHLDESTIDYILKNVFLRRLIVDELRETRKTDDPKQLLCLWVNQTLPQGAQRVSNFTTDWMDGTALAGIMYTKSNGEHFRDWNVIMDPKLKFRNLMKNIRILFSGVERLLEEGDFLSGLVTETSLMLYISQFIHARYTPSNYESIEESTEAEFGIDNEYDEVGCPEVRPVEMFEQNARASFRMDGQNYLNPVEQIHCSGVENITNQAIYLRVAEEFGGALDDYLVDPECLKLGKKTILGQGHFGIVFEARYKQKDGAIMVAAKTLKVDSSSFSPQQMRDLYQEALTLSHFKHNNVVRLVAFTIKDDIPFILQELLDTNILEYIKSRKESLSHLNLNKIVLDVAKGMDYISNLKFIHRDLAARNCMYDKREDCIKVGDFGFARDVFSGDYEGGPDGVLPYRWCPPEVLTDRNYSVKSDVWSFGVVFWEVHSYGALPYTGRNTSAAVALFLATKNRLQKPQESTEEEYEMMKDCWEEDPDMRPTFTQLVSRLKKVSRPKTAVKPIIRNLQGMQN